MMFLKRIALIVMLVTMVINVPLAQAAVGIVPATGGTNLPVGSGFVSLSAILINESAPAEIKFGIHNFTLPSGWEFDTSSMIRFTTNSGALSFAQDTVFPTATGFSMNINSESFLAPADVKIEGLRVRPTGAAVNGAIRHSGASITGVTGLTNFGTLTVQGQSGSVPSDNNGGGGGGVCRQAPTENAVSINGGDKTTSSREVTLHLWSNCAGDVLVSNNEDFAGAKLQPYGRTKSWTLEEGLGEKTVYVKFRNPIGIYSSVLSDTIELISDGKRSDDDKGSGDNNGNDDKKDEEKFLKTDFNKDGKVDFTDLRLLFENWFTTNKLSTYDVNNDSKVSVVDFNAVLVDWTAGGRADGDVAKEKDTRFILSPANVQVRVGEVVTVGVAVRPDKNDIYTARLVLNFPTDILDFSAINFNNNWIPLLLSSENNKVDEANGVMVKTAGRPGGIEAETQFAVITFVAKRAGSGTIMVNSGSVAMNADGHNKFSGQLDSTAVVVMAAKSGAVTVPVTGGEGRVSQPDDKDEDQEKDEEVCLKTKDLDDFCKELLGVDDENQNGEGGDEISDERKKESRESLLASIGGFFGSVPGIILILIIIALIIYYLVTRKKEEEDSETELKEAIRQAGQEKEEDSQI